MILPSTTRLLIAHPFLKDPHFSRSVVFLCKNEEAGAFGFLLNKPFFRSLEELLPDVMDGLHFPVFAGGPVQTDALNFIHRYPHYLGESEEVMKDIFLGGNFESLLIHLKNDDIEETGIRFFIGYSGWSEGQLDREIEEGSWLTAEATRKLLFETPPEHIWKEALRQLGGDYAMLANYPADPQLN